MRRLVSEDFAAVGGPNVPPTEDHWIPEVVARCPGGPTHVLLTDLEAEHVPGCNMAFWRDKLLEVGLFDPIYRAAGDDVDICWRLQNAGYKIGFAASALVWHRRRATIGAYLQQQRGYGRAESLLYFKHPYRFNLLGGSRWLGRIYSDLGAGIFARRAVIYSGPLGSALFQTLYEAPASLLRHLPATLEWNGLALLLTADRRTLVSHHAAPSDLPRRRRHALRTLHRPGRRDLLPGGLSPSSMSRRWKARGLVAILNYLGPFVRAIERNKVRMRGMSSVERIRFPKLRQRPEVDLLDRGFRLSYWNTTGIEKEACIAALVNFLRPRKYPIVLDNGWERWDASVHRGIWIRGEVRVLVQNHGGNDRQVDVGVRLRRTGLPKAMQLTSAGVGLLALIGGVPSVAALFGSAFVAMEVFLGQQLVRLGRTLYHAVEITFQSLPLAPLCPDEAARPPEE